jgi:hypothetical protein
MAPFRYPELSWKRVLKGSAMLAAIDALLLLASLLLGLGGGGPGSAIVVGGGVLALATLVLTLVILPLVVGVFAGYGAVNYPGLQGFLAVVLERLPVACAVAFILWRATGPAYSPVGQGLPELLVGTAVGVIATNGLLAFVGGKLGHHLSRKRQTSRLA